jgi:hypothetical protein
MHAVHAYCKYAVQGRKTQAVRAGKAAKGGLLALEMGMGKTLVMIAAHALQQHKLPEAPIMHTQYTDEELMQYEEVLVGKDLQTAKEVPMFTGFKQLDDEKGTIVPDGSVRRLLAYTCRAAPLPCGRCSRVAVRRACRACMQLRFTGRGNLVIVPVALAPQWEKEIARLTTQRHSVAVLEGLKERRHFMTSKAGLKECATRSSSCAGAWLQRGIQPRAHAGWLGTTGL